MWPFKKKPEQRSITELDWGTGGPIPGVGTIGMHRALSLVPVFGAVRLLADTVASLTPVLYTKDKKGIQKELPTPSLFVNPSVHGTLFDWLHRGTTSMALQGDAIGLITQRDYLGFPTMIEWLHPEQVATQDGALSGVGSYMNPVWFWNGRGVNPQDIVHIPWFCLPYRVRGLSPLEAYAATANVGLGAQVYAAEWFNNGGVPPGVFKNSQQRVNKEEADLITARVTRRLRDRKPLVYGNDWEYTPIAIKPHEAQFVETMRLTATEIAVIYGIPPEKIGGSTGSTLTYNTVEMNTLDYLTFSARPWLVRWECALSKLFPRGQFVKFEISEMLRTDVKTRAEVDRISLGPNDPWKTVDEVRAARDLGPMPKPPPPDIPLQLQPVTGQPPDQQPSNGQPVNGQQPQPSNGQPPARSGPDAVLYLRSRMSTPEPPLAAYGMKPLAVD